MTQNEFNFDGVVDKEVYDLVIDGVWTREQFEAYLRKIRDFEFNEGVRNPFGV